MSLHIYTRWIDGISRGLFTGKRIQAIHKALKAALETCTPREGQEKCMCTSCVRIRRVIFSLIEARQKAKDIGIVEPTKSRCDDPDAETVK